MEDALFFTEGFSQLVSHLVRARPAACRDNRHSLNGKTECIEYHLVTLHHRTRHRPRRRILTLRGVAASAARIL